MAHQHVNVVSFWVKRPEEHPDAPDYRPLLGALQRSCDRLGLRHVCATDETTADDMPGGIETFATALPKPLMRAATESYARWCEFGDWQDGDTLFVGADCLIQKHPFVAFPEKPGLCVTLRPGHKKYPINSGAMMLRARRRHTCALLYREIADRCGTTWCDDQRAIAAALAPMPTTWGTFKRFGFGVAFLPMDTFNAAPKSANDAKADAVVLHFRQKRKAYMVEWGARYLGI